MALDDCIRGVMEILGDESLSEKDLKMIAKEVDRRAQAIRRRNSAQGDADVLAEAAQMVTDDVRRAALTARRNNALNFIIFDRAMQRVDAGVQSGLSAAKAIRALSVGNQARGLDSARMSADALGNTRHTSYVAQLLDGLERAGVLEILTKRKGPDGQGEGYLDFQIAQEMWAVSAGEPSVTGVPEARKVAEVFHEVQERARLEANRAGAAIASRPDYIVSQSYSHDQGKIIKAGEDLWIERIIGRLDESTFGDANPKKFLQEAYRSLINGEGVRTPDLAPHDIQFTGPSNLAKRISHHRVLHFKSAADWYAYHQEFGSASLIESVMRGLDASARNTALMETFGPNPRAMYDRIIQASRERYYKGRRVFSRHDEAVLKNEFAEIDGTTRQVANMTFHHIAAIIRAQQSASKLGLSTITSLTDIATSISDLRYQDGDFAGAVHDYLTVGLGLTGPEARELAMALGVGFDGLTGDVSTRWSATDNLPGIIAKANRAYYKLNLLTSWTDGRKRAFALVMAYRMAKRLKGGFDELTPRHREVLNMYGITEREWRVMQSAETRAADGRDYFLADSVRSLDEDALRPIIGDDIDRIETDIGTRRADLEARLETASEEAAVGIRNKLKMLEPERVRRRKATIERGRDTLATKILTFYTDRADHGVPTPGARERAIFNRGTLRGSVEGEVLRSMAHLKMFPTTVITKNIERDLGGYGLRAALFEGRGDIVGLASHIAMLTIFGMAAMQIKEIVKGKTPRPIFGENSVATWTAALSQGGGLGIYGDFLLQNYNEYGRSLPETILGPTFALGNDSLALLQSMFSDLENSGPQLNRFIQSNIPGINLFYTKAALDYLILWRLNEWVSPGWARRMQRRVEDKGQKFIGPTPTEVVNG